MGVFRLAPDKEECDSVKRQLNMNTFSECEDVNCIANLIKVWFRDLPQTDAILGALAKGSLNHIKTPAQAGKVVDGLDDSQSKSILLWLLSLAALVAANEDNNKMNPQNLGIVMGPNLVPPSFGETPEAYSDTCEFIQRAIEWR